MSASVQRCAGTRAACAALAPAPLGGVSGPACLSFGVRRKAFGMRTGYVLSAVIVVAALIGCETEPDHPGARLGMTREELRARCGDPVRIERTEASGEDWYYHFSVWATPEVQARSVPDCVSSSVGVSVSDTRVVEERPIHVSADGYVVEPLPAGRFVR